jgi:hypothetical protein
MHDFKGTDMLNWLNYINCLPDKDKGYILQTNEHFLASVKQKSLMNNKKSQLMNFFMIQLFINNQ